LFAEVIIPIPIPKTYTYLIPPSMESAAMPGVRVEVSFGKKKRYAGVIKSISNDPPKGFEPKSIIQILDPEPIIYQEQLLLWNWIANYYMCSEGEVMAAALPTHLKLSSETILIWNEEYGEDFSNLDDKEYLVAEGLLLKKELKLDEVQDILDATHVYPVVKSLLDKKLCFAWESLKERYTVKKEIFIRLHPSFQNEDALAKLLNQWNNKAPKQLELLLAYLHLQKTTNAVKQSELLKKSGATSAQLKGLIEKGILVASKEEVDRVQLKSKDVHIDFQLSATQETAMQQIKSALNEKNICLLYGVTSSGKTLLYIKLIEEQIRQGKQVLYLIPEIALTAQIIRRLEKHFGGYIAIYHSKFNPNERVELWNKVKKGEIRIVLGARSSLFLPFSNLSLIIIDEEQDASFKQQEPSPKYNARDAALYYAQQCKAKVILGSATPSIESYAQAMNGKYGLVELFERYGGVELPSIELADLRTIEGNKKVRKIITDHLKEAIEQTVQQKKQVILFQNRRGYAPYKICGTCGHIPHCEQCDVTLTYHKLQHKLQCHYCGTNYPVFQTCIACGSANWVEKNFGTEKVEELLEEMFPDFTIARMDVDTVKGKTAHDELIRNFEQQRMDILVGTQMVVKGLDFEHVALVGILDADGLLSFTDFRVNERAFQLMEQVSGRAGRRGDRGRVIIQGTNLKHPVIEWVVSHDYKSMYEKEIASRQIFHYPPYTRIIQLFFRHADKGRTLDAASFVANRLSTVFGDYLIGPAEPVINRIRNKYIYEILLKLPRDSEKNTRARILIQQALLMMQSEATLKSVHVQINVDPQ
jgi:primosomal protein N' (replication factor Y) (superfamily II helicase)